MKLKALIILALAISACGGASTTSITNAPETTPASTTEAVAPTYSVEELNRTRCGKWLDEGRTKVGLQQMVLDNQDFDWRFTRDSNSDGYPCEDEVGVGYLPTTTTTTQATTTTTRPPTTTTRPTTTTTLSDEELEEIDDAIRDFAFQSLISDHPILSGYPISNLKEIALAVCSDLDDGDSMEAVALNVYIHSPDDWDVEVSGTFLGWAVGSYCPEYLDDMEQ